MPDNFNLIFSISTYSQDVLTYLGIFQYINKYYRYKRYLVCLQQL